MGSIGSGISYVLTEFKNAEVIVTQVANRISESEITGNLEEAIETRISNDEIPSQIFNSENPLQSFIRIEHDNITKTGMSLIGFCILLLCNLSMTIAVIICYYINIPRGKLYNIFFYLSIIFNILTIIITCVKIVEYKKLVITHQVSDEICKILLLCLVNIILTLVTLVYSIINVWNTWAKRGKNEMFLIVVVTIVGCLEFFLITLFEQHYKVLPDEEPGELRLTLSQRIDKGGELGTEIRNTISGRISHVSV